MTELTVIQNDGQYNVIRSFDDVQNVAKLMVQSNYFTDAKDFSQAVVKILAGREIGVGPFASMNGIHIIKGKPAFSANMMADRLKSSGRYNYRVVEMTDTNCVIDYYEHFNGKWEKSGTSSFSLADARKAGTQNLDKFPRNMLFARAMSNGIKWFCPDVMSSSTVYTPEELGAIINEEGEPINPTAPKPVYIDPLPIEPEQSPEPVEQPKPAKKAANRPLEPEKLLDMLKRRAQNSNPTTLAQDTEIRTALQHYLVGDESLRHAVQMFLLDVPSLNSKEQPADGKRKMAVHNWLKPREVTTPTGDVILDIDEWAKREIDMIAQTLEELDETLEGDSLPFD